MSYDGSKIDPDKSVLLERALDALERLVDTYVMNQGKKGEFITCITPSGRMVEWEMAKDVLRAAGRAESIVPKANTRKAKS